MRQEKVGTTINKTGEPDLDVMEVINSLADVGDTQDEKDFFSETRDVRRVAKGTILLREGQINKTSYYLFKGCVREYHLKDGEEKTVLFYTAGETLSDEGDKIERLPSSVNWECVTDCIMSFFPYELEKEMYRRFPRLEAQCKMAAVKEYSNYKKEINNYLASTPGERYEHLIQTKPELFQLVPLYHIASYLGVKPESLSRIRNRLRVS
jgi:CRP-like cAMP-binding protein